MAIVILLLASLMVQRITVAQDTESTPADQPQPTEIIQPTDVPTDVPPTDVPAPTDVPEPTATTRPLNTDSIAADNVPAGIVLQQGQSHQFALTYFGTTLTASLQGADGWTVQLTANGAVSEVGTTVALTDATSLEAGSTFPVTVIVTAPATVTAEQSVTVWLSSTAQDRDGLVVPGIVATGPLVSVSATPPPPTPTLEPTITPTPTDESIATPASTATATATITSSPQSAPGTPVAATSCPANGPTSLPMVQAARIGFGSSTDDGSSYPPLTDTITVTVTLPQSTPCLAPHWSILLTASAMTNSDGSIVPASAITYQGVTGLAAPDLAETGIQPSTSLGKPQSIVNGSDKTLDPTHPSTTFGVLVNLSPPPNTPPGDYSGTIVVDSIAAP